MTGTWIEAFRAGKHTSAEGHVREYTNDDLTRIAATYNGQKDHEAPLVYGHPEHDKPAHGWIKELKAMGDRLWAFAECSDDTKAAVDQKSFKKVSIALYANGLLRHIGLLGSMPPAVKGLSAVSFADGDQTFEEFATEDDSLVGKIIAGIKSFLRPGQFTEHQEEDMETKELTALMETMKTEILAGVDTRIGALNVHFSEQITAVNTTVNGIAATSQAATQNVVKEAFVSFCDGLIAEGKVLPGEKEGLVAEYAELVEVDAAKTYAEGIVPMADRMKTRMTARPVLVVVPRKPFANKAVAAETAVPTTFADKKVNEVYADVHARAVTYMETNKVVDYAVALKAVMAS